MKRIFISVVILIAIGCASSQKQEHRSTASDASVLSNEGGEFHCKVTEILQGKFVRHLNLQVGNRIRGLVMSPSEPSRLEFGKGANKKIYEGEGLRTDTFTFNMNYEDESQMHWSFFLDSNRTATLSVKNQIVLKAICLWVGW